MVKRRAAPNPEAMMIAVRFAGGRRVDGEDGEGEDGEGDDGDEEVFMVFFFFFFSFYFYFILFLFYFISVLFFQISSRELFVVVVGVVVVAFLFCDGDFFLLILSFQKKKLGRSSCCLVGWLVAGFSFFDDFGVFFFSRFCAIAIFTYEWPAS